MLKKSAVSVLIVHDETTTKEVDVYKFDIQSNNTVISYVMWYSNV